MNGGFNFFDMFTGNADLFAGGALAGAAGVASVPRHPTTVAPPASKRILRNLPTVQVTQDDLIEETNKNCCICLEDQEIGATAVKLPCGHIYHPPCLKEWLEKCCTCPVCRFELETDDANYEQDRKQRMCQRKLRFRRDEIDSKSVSKLKEIMLQLGISFTGCVDKQDMIERIIQSGKIDIVEGLPPVEMSFASLKQKSVKELRQMLLSFGLPIDGAIEKKELTDRLVQSGRVILNDLNKTRSEGRFALSL